MQQTNTSAAGANQAAEAGNTMTADRHETGGRVEVQADEPDEQAGGPRDLVEAGSLALGGGRSLSLGVGVVEGGRSLRMGLGGPFRGLGGGGAVGLVLGGGG
jgi:hypothetical protein